jgi:hypothetical protein
MKVHLRAKESEVDGEAERDGGGREAGTRAVMTSIGTGVNGGQVGPRLRGVSGAAVRGWVAASSRGRRIRSDPVQSHLLGLDLCSSRFCNWLLSG